MIVGPSQPCKERSGNKTKKAEVQNAAQVRPARLCLDAFQYLHRLGAHEHAQPCGSVRAAECRAQNGSLIFFAFGSASRQVNGVVEGNKGRIPWGFRHECGGKVLVDDGGPFKGPIHRFSTDEPLLSRQKITRLSGLANHLAVLVPIDTLSCSERRERNLIAQSRRPRWKCRDQITFLSHLGFHADYIGRFIELERFVGGGYTIGVFVGQRGRGREVRRMAWLRCRARVERLVYFLLEILIVGEERQRRPKGLDSKRIHHVEWFALDR